MHQQRAGALDRDHRRVPRSGRVANHDHVAADALERRERRARTLLEAGLRVGQRQVGSQRLVATSGERLGRPLPARSVVPGSVQEAERGHGHF